MTPAKIKEWSELNLHISNEELEQDISDTEAEIAKMTNEAEHLAATPLSDRDARLNHIRADARRSGIKKRQEFVEKLRAILAYRRRV